MLKNQSHTRGTRGIYAIETDLQTWADAFLLDRKAQNLSKGTLEFHRKKLKLFLDFCHQRELRDISQISPTCLREFLSAALGRERSTGPLPHFQLGEQARENPAS